MYFKKIVTLLTAGLFLFQIAYSQTADIVLLNGKIFTADTSQLWVEALATKDNTIIATGSSESLKKFIGENTKAIDLKGKTVIPGFNAAHEHPNWYPLIKNSFNYMETDPAGPVSEAVLDSVARLAKVAGPNEWIHGLIGTTVLFDTSMRESLDRLAPNNPVVLQTWWGNGLVVNQNALEASGLYDEDTDPAGGWYVRTPGTNKINTIHQNAQAPVWIALYHSEPTNLLKGLRIYAEEQLQGGITSVQFMGTGFDGEKADAIFREANLPQRIRIIAWPRSTAEGRQLSDWELDSTQPAPLVTISGIKYLFDGTPMEGNALRSTPYPGRPNWYGRLNYTVDTMKQIFKESLTSDRQLMIHVTADSSFSVVLSLMQQLGTGDDWRPKRVRIEHNCVGDLSPAQKETVKDFGILLIHTPKICMGSPLLSLVEYGIVVGIGADGTTNPFIDIMMITGMQSNPKENLTIEQAVISYTKNNAYAEFSENSKGTLVKGMFADLAVLSQDIFTIPANQLPATQSLLTIVDGKIVYEQP
jgi:predicted amidohydrolase YtcJ